MQLSNNNQPCGAVLRHVTQVTSKAVERANLCLAQGRICRAPGAGAWECDLREHLVFPGLINAHDHLHLNAFPLLAFARPFSNSYAWMEAFQCHMDDPEIAAARAIPKEIRYWHGALKNVLGGVTTVAHHDPYAPLFDHPDFPVQVLKRCGWSHSLGLGLPDSARSSLRYGPHPQESFAATPASQPWIIHLAEGTDTVAQEELEELDALGCLAANTLLAHGVGLTIRDQEKIVARGAGVLWCPGSNLAMLGQTLAPGRLLAAGRLGLGSDSRLSGPADLLDNLRLAAQHSEQTPQELFALVTDAAARLLRLPNVGGLHVGQQADLLITRDPGGDPYAALLALHRREIRAVVRRGLPALTDLDFDDWFDACGIPFTPIMLDGTPKLIATALLGPPGAAQQEPGLCVCGKGIC